jgi:hypothetical protein
MNDQSGAWLTYAEAGHRLGVSPDAVRTKAVRKRCRKQIGNDGRARVWLPEDERTPADRPVIGRSSRDHRSIAPALVTALESHIKTLQAENEALKQDLTATRADLSAHVETLKTQKKNSPAPRPAGPARKAPTPPRRSPPSRASPSSLRRWPEAKRPAWRRWLGLAG